MKVQTVDYRAGDAARRFADSLRETGFGVLAHHPIPRDLVETVRSEWQAFFDSEAKTRYAYDGKTQDGWFAPELSERAKGAAVKDLKEYFHVFPWGRFPEEVSDAALRYHRVARELAAELLGWIEAATPAAIRNGFSMPLPEMIADSPRTLLRILHYPPLSGDEPAGALRAAAHEDINLLTVLAAANEPGLEVRDAAGTWHRVPCDFGTLVVNVGDMLKEASAGHWPSTTHRVVNPEGEARRRSRISMPLFLHPRDEVRLSERHTALSHLEERLRELGVRP